MAFGSYLALVVVLTATGALLFDAPPTWWYLATAVEVSDSVLSKQVSTLERAGYVTVDKGYVGKRPRTWLSLTTSGAAAFRAHCAALRSIANTADSATSGA